MNGKNGKNPDIEDDVEWLREILTRLLSEKPKTQTQEAFMVEIISTLIAILCVVAALIVYLAYR